MGHMELNYLQKERLCHWSDLQYDGLPLMKTSLHVFFTDHRILLNTFAPLSQRRSSPTYVLSKSPRCTIHLFRLDFLIYYIEGFRNAVSEIWRRWSWVYCNQTLKENIATIYVYMVPPSGEYIAINLKDLIREQQKHIVLVELLNWDK